MLGHWNIDSNKGASCDLGCCQTWKASLSVSRYSIATRLGKLRAKLGRVVAREAGEFSWVRESSQTDRRGRNLWKVEIDVKINIEINIEKIWGVHRKLIEEKVKGNDTGFVNCWLSHFCKSSRLWIFCRSWISLLENSPRKSIVLRRWLKDRSRDCSRASCCCCARSIFRCLFLCVCASSFRDWGRIDGSDRIASWILLLNAGSEKSSLSSDISGDCWESGQSGVSKN